MYPKICEFIVNYSCISQSHKSNILVENITKSWEAKMPTRKEIREQYSNTPFHYWKEESRNGIKVNCYSEVLLDSIPSVYLSSHLVQKASLSRKVSQWIQAWPEKIRSMPIIDPEFHKVSYRPLHLLGFTDNDLKDFYSHWKESTWRKLENAITALETITTTPVDISYTCRDELQALKINYEGHLKVLRREKPNAMKLYVRGFLPLVSLLHRRGLNAYKIQQLLLLFLEEFDFPLSDDFDRHKRIYRAVKALGFPEYYESQDIPNNLNP
jgi:hypothetical protein